MLTLSLSEEQASYLQIILQGRLSDLSFEIARTDTRGFREELRRRYDLLVGLLALLTPPPPGAQAPAAEEPRGA